MPEIFRYFGGLCAKIAINISGCIRIYMLCNTTFIQHRPKDGQIVIDGGAVPASAPELVLALLDANLHPLSHAGHDLHVVPAETQLLRY